MLENNYTQVCAKKNFKNAREHHQLQTLSMAIAKITVKCNKKKIKINELDGQATVIQLNVKICKIKVLKCNSLLHCAGKLSVKFHHTMRW